MTTSSSFELAGSTEYSIPELVKLAREGSLRIPNFQRSFVWDAVDVRQLFDSIYRGFPIGTLLLWRREAPASQISFGPISFQAPHRTDALWVIDGQQRITSLFGALTPDWPSRDERFEVYFDLATRRFATLRRNITRARTIPIREALETKLLASWVRMHGDDLEPDDFDLADTLVGAIRDYRVSAYVVTEDDEYLLREVFDRVNSTGKPITRAQVFHALFASETTLGSPLVVVKELSRLGFGAIDENRVTQSLLAIRGGDVQRDFHDEFSAGDDPADWFDRAEQALAKAIRFLRSQGIPHIALMPYTLPLPVLAAFFHLHPEPSHWNLRLLARWLWRIWIQGDSGTATLRRAVRIVNPRRLAASSAPTEYEAAKSLVESLPAPSPPAIKLDGFRTDAAPSRLLLLALASLGPLRPDRTEMDLAAEFEKHGHATVTELVPGRRSHAATRGFWPVDAAPLTGEEDARVLRTHAIDEDAAESLRGGDIDSFIQRRAATLDSVTHDFISNRIEAQALVRPPLQDLFIPDPEDDGQNE